MAKEYIDKNRLILCMNEWMLQNAPRDAGDDTTRADTIMDAIKMVEDSPAADVRENVKGEWDMDSVAFYRKCPNCKCCVRDNRYEVFLDNGGLHYCPNCGAQMGGAEDA